MANRFEPFDKTAVTSGHTAKHCGLFTLREIVLASVALIVLVVCLVFVALYVAKANENDSCGVDQDVCVTKDCMETASYSMQLMNTSVDPCEDFYQYACGNYKTEHPVIERDRTVMSDLKDFNDDRLEEIILQGRFSGRQTFQEDTYDKKLYDFIYACRYSRGQFLTFGPSLEDQIVPKLGGWDLLGNWKEEDWDFKSVFKKVQSDFMVNALVTIEVLFNQTGSYIQLMPYVREDLDLRNYSRRLGALLQRDAKLKNMTKEEQDDRLDQFVNDTSLFVEKLQYTPERIIPQLDLPPYQVQMTIKDLSELTRGIFDWEGLLSYKFRPATINNQTKVLVFPRYLQKISNVIQSLPGVDKKRILHNFLMFSVFDFYVEGLSEEYMLVKSAYDYRSQLKGFRNLDRYCLQMAQKYMKDALGALFIKLYFDDNNRQKARKMAEYLKTALQLVLDKTPWMDKETKKRAKSKLDSITMKIGYPDWMGDDKLVDLEYQDFFNREVSFKFIDHLISGNQFLRLDYAKDLIAKHHKEKWILGVYDTAVRLVFYRNELIVTAGLLQNPIYDVDAPLYRTFGSLGTILGTNLHHVVGGYGEQSSEFDYMGGRKMEDKSWWSDSSIQKYSEVTKCVQDVYSKKFWTMRYPNGVESKIPVRVDVTVAIATTSGIRLALKSYREWTDGASEKKLPGLGLTPEQMFFLSYAQNYCSASMVMNTEADGSREITRVNGPLGQLQEFSQAFQCKPKSEMNNEQKCPYY